MRLRDLFKVGRPVVGSSLDRKLKPLVEISEAAQKRLGYADSQGYWTDKGYDRATTRDYERLDAATRMRRKG